MIAEVSDDCVECYSGHAYASEPRAVFWQGKRDPVARIESRWRLPQGPGFQIRTETGMVLVLQYAECEDRWTIAPLVGASRA